MYIWFETGNTLLELHRVDSKGKQEALQTQMYKTSFKESAHEGPIHKLINESITFVGYSVK